MNCTFNIYTLAITNDEERERSAIKFALQRSYRKL